MGFLSEVFGGGSARRKGSAGSILGAVLGTTGRGGGIIGAATGKNGGIGGIVGGVVSTAGSVVASLEEAKQAKRISKLENVSIRPPATSRTLPGAGLATGAGVVVRPKTGLVAPLLGPIMGIGGVIKNGFPTKGSMKPTIGARLPIPRQLPPILPPVDSAPGMPGFGGGGLIFPRGLPAPPSRNGNGNGVRMRNGRIGDVMVRGRPESLFVGTAGVPAPTFAVHPVTGALEDVEQLRIEGFQPKRPFFRYDWRNNRWKKVGGRRMNPCNPRAVKRAFRRIGMLDKFIKSHFKLQRTVKVKPKARKRR